MGLLQVTKHASANGSSRMKFQGQDVVMSPFSLPEAVKSKYQAE